MAPARIHQAYVFTDFMSAAELVEARDFAEHDVRAKLGIPFNPWVPAIQYEHPKGQPGALPPNILRQTGHDIQVGS